MSQTHARPGTESSKRQGDAREGAAPKKDAVPVPEDGGHGRSHAAHLGRVHESTRPADTLKEGMASNTLREPPMVVNRVGKQKRG